MRNDSPVTAAVIPAPNEPVRLERFPAPRLEPGAALLRVDFAEVCGTDVHLHHGRLAGVPYPLIPGHVAVGTIAELNGRIVDVEGEPFAPGDVVTFLDVHETCNACYQCLVAKQTTRCPHRRVYGITYGTRDGLLGGWAEALWLKPGVKLVRIPPTLAPETFIGGGCGLVTALHAVDRAELRLGQSVAVLGVGPVGQSAIGLAALSGAGEIFAVGAPDGRLALARRFGATHALSLDLPREARRQAVLDATRGRGVDAVIEAAGAPDAVADALDLVRDGGRVVICGHYTDNGPVLVHPHHQINKKHVEIRGTWGADFSHFYRAVQVADRFGERVPWRELAARRFPLEQAGEALAAVEAQAVAKAVLVPSAAGA